MKNKCDFPLDCCAIHHHSISQFLYPIIYLLVILRLQYSIEFLDVIDSIWRLRFERIKHKLVFFWSPNTFMVEEGVVDVSILVLWIVLYLCTQVFGKSINEISCNLSIRECFLQLPCIHSNLLDKVYELSRFFVCPWLPSYLNFWVQYVITVDSCVDLTVVFCLD